MKGEGGGKGDISVAVSGTRGGGGVAAGGNEVGIRGPHRHLWLEDVDGVLVVLADAEVAVAADDSLRGRQLSRHELEERRLAGSVGPDEGDARVAVDAELEVGVEVVLLLAAVGEADLREGEHRRGQLLAIGELEVEV